jgi:outer membrane protein assembly factor BamA
MKFVWLGGVLLASFLQAGTHDSNINVNARYTVENVIVAGNNWTLDVQSQSSGNRISRALRRDLQALVGNKLNPSLLDTLAGRLSKEYAAHQVTHRLLRGENPEYVRVRFDVVPKRTSVDVRVSQFLYNSADGWSGSGEAGFTVSGNSFAFGLASDGDSLPERYSGISARYENKRLGTDRLGVRFQFESYHQQWNPRTLEALASDPSAASEAYRSRQNFQPTATVGIAKPLTLEVGVRFERLEQQLPAAHMEASNALVSTLRYQRGWEGDGGRQDLDAAYTLRAASRALASDYVYTTHFASLRYRYVHGRHVVSDEVFGGVIGGRAPLDGRFVLGNSRWLRGWDKYELDPMGGNRVVSNSVEYRYGPFNAFYDTGAIWDAGQPVVGRHSVGVGVRESAFVLAVAFPIRSGRMEPILILGMNY